MLRDLVHAWRFSGMLLVLALAGTGTVADQPALAQTGAPSPSPGSTSHPCHLLTSAQSVPDGHGAAYNVFSVAKELLLEVECGSSSNATLTVGNGQNTTYIYRVAYEWINGAWKEIALSGPERAASDWYVGTATANLMRSQAQLAGDNFVVAYTCLWQNNAWKCGCRDSSCSQAYWQLQAFASSSNAHDAKVRAAPGQVSDEYLRSSDAYYLSADITGAARNKVNERVDAWRDVWDKCHPEVFVDTNSKSKAKMYGCAHDPWIEPADAYEKVINQPSQTNAGVLRFTNRNFPSGVSHTQKEPVPTRNFRHVTLNLMMRNLSSNYFTGGVLDRHKENVDYEYGFTFWQGGSENWLRKVESSGSTAIWQVHGDGAILYMAVNRGSGTVSMQRKTSPGSSLDTVINFPLTSGHDDIHVIKIQYRFGSNGHVRVWYNGDLKGDVKTRIEGFANYYPQLMNYRNPPGEYEAILYMDRVYRRAR
jgi:hypothetical protein